MIWVIVGAVIVAFILGFALAMEIGRVIYNRKMDDIQDVAANLDTKIKHFDKAHFTGVTVQGRKFVYCPVGSICSWSEGDYDHKWCHWCKKYFSEIGS